MDGPKLGLGQVFVVLMIFVVVGKTGKAKKADEKQEAGKSLHRIPAKRARQILVTRPRRVKRAAWPTQRTGHPEQRDGSLESLPLLTNSARGNGSK